MTVDDTLRILAAHPRIPTPPAVVLQVLEVARQPDCSLAEVGKLLSTDPGLSGKILRTINSALFGLPRPVLSVQRAVGLIGVNTTRAMVLSLSLPEMSQGFQPSERLRRYWKHSLSCAVSARELAQRLQRPDPEEDLAAGLLCDLGTIVLEQAMPDQYARVRSSGLLTSGQALCEQERCHCLVDHAQVSAHILRGWRFPEEFVDAIACHHTRPTSADRAAILYLASQIADLLTDGPAPEIYRDLLVLADKHFGMSEAAVQDFIAPLQPKMRELAQLMNVDAGTWTDSAAVLAQAAEELVALTWSASQQVHRDHIEKVRAQEEANRWRAKAACDDLTGLYNRRFFFERLREECARSRRLQQGLGLLFIDLDGFKELNDRFGHAFGDQVLREVARQITCHVRLEDVVARMGGDEFCVLAGNVDEAGIGLLADRILNCIRSHDIHLADCLGRVGASIGAVVVYPHLGDWSEREVLDQADRAMYQAKKAGRNRVHLLPRSHFARDKAVAQLASG